ncbi:MAG: hypothetical protein R6V12_00030 [Candidatus Hydrogenedentota bacterium]
MMHRQGLQIIVMCLVLFLILAYFSETAYAAAAGGANDLSEKKGIEGLLSKKSSGDDPRAPNKTQKFVGIGSFFVMIIVVKYL